MKATMVEFLNEHNKWVWFKVSLSRTPQQAMGDYLKQHFDLEDIKGWRKDIKKIGNEYYSSDQDVRAYRINIED